jgi:hypothetical protein
VLAALRPASSAATTELLSAVGPLAASASSRMEELGGNRLPPARTAAHVTMQHEMCCFGSDSYFVDGIYNSAWPNTWLLLSATIRPVAVDCLVQ